MVKSFIQNFSIQGLFGYKNVSIDFEDNVKIIVSENGAGKTTILSCLYYLLVGDYESLLKVKFSAISIKFASRDERFYFEKSQIRSYCQYLINSRDDDSGIVSLVRRAIGDEELEILVSKDITDDDVDELYSKYHDDIHLPKGIWHQVLSSCIETDRKYKKFKDLNQYLKSTAYKFLYYPTYRRIEEDFRNVFKGKKYPRRQMNPRFELSEYFENTMIKFGMKDVRERINKIIDEIKQSSVIGFATVSGSMITKLLETNSGQEESQNFDVSEVSIVLSRVGNNMSDEDKEKIKNQIRIDPDLSEQSPFLRYFLSQLLLVYKNQRKLDIAIKAFVDVCNKYLESKRFVYDESNVTLRIVRIDSDDVMDGSEANIDLENLSSGEKQIVSIFSQLYLEYERKFIILFDEPELSLSLFWQQALLPDIMNSNKCMFLLSATHSPFIYDNDLRDKAVALSVYTE